MSSTAEALSRNLTVPLSEVVRARVSEGRVALPVRGAIYARLNHIAAVPSHSPGEGYSLSRLRVVDSMIGRIARMNEELAIDRAADPLEQQEQLIEETARRVNESIDAQDALSGSYQALLLDLTA